MSLIDRFMGQPAADDPADALRPEPGAEHPLGYQILFREELELDPEALAKTLRAVHPSLADARAELERIDDETRPGAGQSLVGLAGWGNHVVKLIGFNLPIPAPVLEACVRPSHISQALKEEAGRHGSHMLLWYCGRETDPHEQYVALTILGAALARFNALLILNESARTAFPAAALLEEAPAHDSIEMLRALPIPLLFAGFVKFVVEGRKGVWMRTFGCHLLNLPDLARHAAGHHEGSETFDLFANVLAYVRESGATLGPGHTMQVGDNVFLRLRSPLPDEWHLKSDSALLIVETISAAEVNPHT